jgi:uncharacterized DUF497 family protein
VGDVCYSPPMRFEWDAGKAARNLTKHGLSFQEAATVLGDPLSVTFADPDHSRSEDRFITIGHTRRGRLVLVAHADRGTNVRIISAREATTRERKIYEESGK